jgi:hypothetical protein
MSNQYPCKIEKELKWPVVYRKLGEIGSYLITVPPGEDNFDMFRQSRVKCMVWLQTEAIRLDQGYWAGRVDYEPEIIARYEWVTYDYQRKEEKFESVGQGIDWLIGLCEAELKVGRNHDG